MKVMPYIGGSAVAVILAGLIGIRVFKKLNRKIITKVIYITLPIMAILLLKDL